MKINFITATMAGGGTERVIAILANRFIAKGYDVEIILLADPTVSYELNTDIKLTQLTQKTYGNVFARINRIYRLRKHFRKNKGSVYFSFGTETNLFAIVASLLLNRRLIISERNDPNKCSFCFLRNVLYQFAKEFVFQTNDARTCFSWNIQDKGIVIPNPISEFSLEPYIGERDKTIVAVGRLEKQKNHKLLIQAFSEFLKNFSEYKLIIYGEGCLELELKNQINSLGLSNHVVLAGFTNNISDKIRTAGMYTLSSDYEGISNSLLEAMGMGVPVISTDCPIGGSKMLIQNGINGLLVPVGDCESLTLAMKQIAEDNVLANKLSDEAVKVREAYSVERIYKMWEELVQ